MGDAADDLTNDMMDAYCMHVAGECGGDCEWCLEEEEDLDFKEED